MRPSRARGRARLHAARSDTAADAVCRPLFQRLLWLWSQLTTSVAAPPSLRGVSTE